VDQAIGRDARVPVRMTVDRPIAPKPAVTHYQPLRAGRTPEDKGVTLVQCALETGRTHQIRVHLSSVGHALVGDTLYGGKCLAGATRQLLHARALRFEDPGTGGQVAFESPLAQDFQQILDVITWES
jgi:23S rRNA pseudouridine1911/1915/1917 synthase